MASSPAVPVHQLPSGSRSRQGPAHLAAQRTPVGKPVPRAAPPRTPPLRVGAAAPSMEQRGGGGKSTGIGSTSGCGGPRRANAPPPQVVWPSSRPAWPSSDVRLFPSASCRGLACSRSTSSLHALVGSGVGTSTPGTPTITSTVSTTCIVGSGNMVAARIEGDAPASCSGIPAASSSPPVPAPSVTVAAPVSMPLGNVTRSNRSATPVLPPPRVVSTVTRPGSAFPPGTKVQSPVRSRRCVSPVRQAGSHHSTPRELFASLQSVAAAIASNEAASSARLHKPVLQNTVHHARSYSPPPCLRSVCVPVSSSPRPTPAHQGTALRRVSSYSMLHNPVNAVEPLNVQHKQQYLVQGKSFLRNQAKSAASKPIPLCPAGSVLIGQQASLPMRRVSSWTPNVPVQKTTVPVPRILPQSSKGTYNSHGKEKPRAVASKSQSVLLQAIDGVFTAIGLPRPPLDAPTLCVLVRDFEMEEPSLPPKWQDDATSCARCAQHVCELLFELAKGVRVLVPLTPDRGVPVAASCLQSENCPEAEDWPLDYVGNLAEAAAVVLANWGDGDGWRQQVVRPIFEQVDQDRLGYLSWQSGQARRFAELFLEVCGLPAPRCPSAVWYQLVRECGSGPRACLDETQSLLFARTLLERIMVFNESSLASIVAVGCTRTTGGPEKVRVEEPQPKAATVVNEHSAEPTPTDFAQSLLERLTAWQDSYDVCGKKLEPGGSATAKFNNDGIANTNSCTALPDTQKTHLQQIPPPASCVPEELALEPERTLVTSHNQVELDAACVQVGSIDLAADTSPLFPESSSTGLDVALQEQDMNAVMMLKPEPIHEIGNQVCQDDFDVRMPQHHQTELDMSKVAASCAIEESGQNVVDEAKITEAMSTHSDLTDKFVLGRHETASASAQEAAVAVPSRSFKSTAVGIIGDDAKQDGQSELMRALARRRKKNGEVDVSPVPASKGKKQPERITQTQSQERLKQLPSPSRSRRSGVSIKSSAVDAIKISGECKAHKKDSNDNYKDQCRDSFADLPTPSCSRRNSITIKEPDVDANNVQFVCEDVRDTESKHSFEDEGHDFLARLPSPARNMCHSAMSKNVDADANKTQAERIGPGENENRDSCEDVSELLAVVQATCATLAERLKAQLPQQDEERLQQQRKLQVRQRRRSGLDGVLRNLENAEQHCTPCARYHTPAAAVAAAQAARELLEGVEMTFFSGGASASKISRAGSVDAHDFNSPSVDTPPRVVTQYFNVSTPTRRSTAFCPEDAIADKENIKNSRPKSWPPNAARHCDSGFDDGGAIVITGHARKLGHLAQQRFGLDGSRAARSSMPAVCGEAALGPLGALGEWVEELLQRPASATFAADGEESFPIPGLAYE